MSRKRSRTVRWQRRIGREAIVVAALVVTGCSLISTRDLTGGVDDSDGGKSLVTSCTDGGCTDAPLETSCDADVQTDTSHCGSCDTVCAEGNACVAGKCVTACDAGILYVSASAGSDAFDGCTKTKPKITITAALAAAKANPAINEVHVCRGTYTEQAINVQTPVSLLGSYDCIAWVRTATYGSPTFDGLNLTTLRTTATSVTGTALTISSPVSSTKPYTVDGLRVEGPAETLGNTVSIGIGVTGTPSLTLSNNEIAGAAMSTAVTEGLDVTLGATPEVVNNRIGGGGGDSGAIGIDVQLSASPWIHGNVITTGTSSGGYTAGVKLFAGSPMTGARAMRANMIQAGTGASGDDFPGSFGVVSTTTLVDLIGNTIGAGNSTCTPAKGICGSFGVWLRTNNSGSAVNGISTIAGNRIVGGAASGASPAYVGGVKLESVMGANLVNNAIQSASTAPTISSAVWVLNTPTVTATQNTLFSTGIDFFVQGRSSIAASNNLLLGNTPTATSGLTLSDCTAGDMPIPAFSGNVLAGFATTLATLTVFGGDACTPTNYSSLAALTTAEPTATNNVLLRPTCTSSDATCAVAASCSATASSATPCLSTVIANWDTASQGVATLLDDAQTWKLASTTPCAVAQGGGNVASGGSDAGSDVTSAAYDITGRLRTSPVSIGAYESDGACK